jgi:hypothetical protein
LSPEQYQSALTVGLLCWPLNHMPCLPELYFSAEILFRNSLCLTEFDWCGSLNTVIYMVMRRPTHLQKRDQVLLLWDRSLVFRWNLRVSSEGSGSGYLNHTGCLSSGEIVAEKAYLLRLPRSKLRILVGLITGHCPLNKHLHKLGLIDEPIASLHRLWDGRRVGISLSM